MRLVWVTGTDVPTRHKMQTNWTSQGKGSEGFRSKSKGRWGVHTIFAHLQWNGKAIGSPIPGDPIQTHTFFSGCELTVPHIHLVTKILSETNHLSGFLNAHLNVSRIQVLQSEKHCFSVQWYTSTRIFLHCKVTNIPVTNKRKFLAAWKAMCSDIITLSLTVNNNECKNFTVDTTTNGQHIKVWKKWQKTLRTLVLCPSLFNCRFPIPCERAPTYPSSRRAVRRVHAWLSLSAMGTWESNTPIVSVVSGCQTSAQSTSQFCVSDAPVSMIARIISCWDKFCARPTANFANLAFHRQMALSTWRTYFVLLTVNSLPNVPFLGVGHSYDLQRTTTVISVSRCQLKVGFTIKRHVISPKRHAARTTTQTQRMQSVQGSTPSTRATWP